VARLRALALGAACCFSLIACSGITPGTWFTPQSPKLRVSVARGCAPSDAGVADVVNTVAGATLVLPRPTEGLICQYGSRAGSGLPGSTLLVGHRALDGSEAENLAAVITRLDLRRPSGVFHCPADVGLVTIIGFSYSGRPDVGLWYKASGCQTLDNGRLGAFQGANPSFSDFQSAISAFEAPLPL